MNCVLYLKFFYEGTAVNCSREISVLEGTDLSLICMVGSFRHQRWCDGRIVKETEDWVQEPHRLHTSIPYGRFVRLGTWCRKNTFLKVGSILNLSRRILCTSGVEFFRLECSYSPKSEFPINKSD